jgi:hypothetical protein
VVPANLQVTPSPGRARSAVGLEDDRRLVAGPDVSLRDDGRKLLIVVLVAAGVVGAVVPLLLGEV